MIEFKDLKIENLKELHSHFTKQDFNISTLSVGPLLYYFYLTKKLQYAIVNNCLIILLYWNRGSINFSYPLSKTNNELDEIKANTELILYCEKNQIPLSYFGVPYQKLGLLSNLYGNCCEIVNDRVLSEYLYDIDQFLELKGKKYENIRYHIKQFTKQNLMNSFHEITHDNIKKLSGFIQNWWNTHKDKAQARFANIASQAETLFIDKFFEINSFIGGFLTINGKVESLCVCEKCGDTLFIHIEKNNHNIKGIDAYFLTTYLIYFKNKYGIKYFNRIDDVGLPGLRTSKLRYNPIRLVKSFFFKPYNLFYKMKKVPEIKTDRLVLKDIKDDDYNFFLLSTNPLVNKYYGWNYESDFYKTHSKDEKPDLDFFINERKRAFNNNEEMSIGIYLENQLIGEVLVYDVSFLNTCSIGYRLLPEFQQHGYALEATKAVINYLFYHIGFDQINAKCYLENIASKRLLEKLKMKFKSQDDKFFYFYLTSKMI